MIHDALAAPRVTTLWTQVCIVGGGTAGIFLAAALRRRGVAVVVLESGKATARRPSEIRQLVEQRGIHYRGAEFGRSFGLGGTSVLWGGQMIPVTPSDIGPRPWVGIEAWPVQYEQLKSHFDEVAASLGFGEVAPGRENAGETLLTQRFPALAAMGEDFALRVSTWLPFKTRNFAKEFAELLRRDPDLSVWLNATVTSLNTAPDTAHRAVTSITATTESGHDLTVHATHFVLCAGALETTRFLLEHDARTNGSLTATGSPLGRYFSDHLSATCARFVRHSLSRFNTSVAPIFSRGLMRTPRLELSPATQRAEGLASAFAHVTFRTNGESGFDIVRNFLRRRQGERHTLGLSPRLVGRLTHDVAAMAYWRFIRTRLWIPHQADVLLQVDVEQVPNPDSRLLLSEERDRFGRRRLVVDWRITSSDLAAIRKVTRIACDRWRNSRLQLLADLKELPEQAFEATENLYDVYHPTGTIRMGSSENTSVVDRNLRLWAIDNCYVSTTAVFPSAGSANPGFTHLALTSRLADHITRRIR